MSENPQFETLKIDFAETHMGGGRLIYSDSNPGVAVVMFNGDEDQRDSYAVLFASSPLLLAELKKARRFIQQTIKTAQEEVLQSLDSAILQAENTRI
jgi:hypothetical protein